MIYGSLGPDDSPVTKVLGTLVVIILVLGLWKLFELVAWVVDHVHVTVGVTP